MPRRIPDYPDAYSYFNWVASFGSLVSFFGMFFFFGVIYHTFRKASPDYYKQTSFAKSAMNSFLRQLESYMGPVSALSDYAKIITAFVGPILAFIWAAWVAYVYLPLYKLIFASFMKGVSVEEERRLNK